MQSDTRYTLRRYDEAALLRNLQTMGESTQRLSDDLKATRPEIDWSRIAAFRNVLVRGYLGIAMDVIWEIIQRDVPILKKAILW